MSESKTTNKFVDMLKQIKKKDSNKKAPNNNRVNNNMLKNNSNVMRRTGRGK